MKKIILSVALATAVLSSCSLNEEPVGTLTFNDAFESVEDFSKFRNGLYGDLRAIGTGFYIYATELQADMFNGTIINGNRMGQLANGDVLSSDSDIEAVWGGLYGSINTSNLMITKSDEFMTANTELSDAEIHAMHRYEAEAKFNRAFMYFYLYQHFCQPYDAARADEPNLGLPIVTVYHPTADRASYPGRSSMNQTYALIEQDLTDAYNGLKEYEDNVSTAEIKQNATYLSSWTVRAFQARIALYKGDYETAYKYANDLINQGTWTLTGSSNYKAMFSTDAGSELIFVPFADSSESAYLSATGTAWTSTSGVAADYIPGSALIDLYDNNDIRKETFIGSAGLQINGETVTSPTFIKFPGNTSLDTGLSLSGKNKPKMFRLSEMYLIAAEAACLKATKDEGRANTLLNELRKTRAKNNRFYKDVDYSGDELVAQIRDERLKELVGEGFRLFDLRRYHQAFVRTFDYDNEEVAQILVLAGRQVSYIANDYRYVWPIPTAEINVNPQIKGHQNPGYN